MRNEYPRPDFIREKWMPLNGTWNFQDGTDKTPVKIAPEQTQRVSERTYF